MIRKILTVLCLGSLVACGGGGGKAKLVDACVGDGDSKEVCVCMADKLEEDLSPEAFDAIVASADGDEEAIEAAMEELGIAGAMELGGAMMGAVAACGVTNFN